MQAGHGRAVLSMGQAVLILSAVGAGMLNALQIALIGGIARERGAWEATWISMLASLTGMAVVLGILAFSGTSLGLARPFGSPWVYVAFSAAMAGSLVIAGNGLPLHLQITGLAAIPYLLVASLVGPRLGLAVFFASIVSGQLIGSVAMDHIGAFGATARPFSLSRALGILALLAGVVLIRGGK